MDLETIGGLQLVSESESRAELGRGLELDLETEGAKEGLVIYLVSSAQCHPGECPSFPVQDGA